MNWDDLKLFLAVSRQPRLEQAAANLRIDSTTLSRHLRRLESALGQTLFERTRRGHILTPQGEALLEHAEAMESASLAVQRAGEKDHDVTGHIRLGVTEGFGTGIIAPALKKFSETWPSVTIDLIALSGFMNVSKREADISILLTRPEAGRVRVRKLSDYALYLYGTEEYISQHEPITNVETLADHKLIGYVDDLIYSPQLRYFSDILPGLTPSFASPSILTQLEMANAGLGLCILPKFLAEEQTRLVPVLPDLIEVERTFWMAIHEDVRDFARIRLMTNFLVDYVKKRSAELH